MKKAVVKIGSSVIAPAGRLDPNRIANIIKDILEAERKGWKVILVSSGAIACGMNKLGFKKRPHDNYSLMALASLGQILLMDIYAEKFKNHKKFCAQILLTWDDFDNRKRFLNARQTINKLLRLEIVPVINENDAVSYEEIRFGDNDRLSALVGDMVEAQALIILSDVDGLIKEGKVIKVVSEIDSKIFRLAKSENKIFTAGGMFTKLEAARIASLGGIKTVIANGGKENVISDILNEADIGTVFLPCQKIEAARKRWIAFSKKIKGKICIDDGAKEAVINKGKSLLGVGVIRTEGDFKRKDAVCVVDREGKILGCGLINYSCEDLRELKGKKFEKEIIHRDNFVRKSS
jgi:glutamate 5-kinase